ncbi:MAG TPA: phosphoglycerate dehydrogenase [Microscillaceae bacterium]|nr:phosphoglycerate dehydrogenase [Microscillaceae bacterium]
MNKPFKALIADLMHPTLPTMLAQIGVETDYQPQISRADILAQIGAYEAIVIRSKTALDAAFFDKATSLKLIARAGSGLDLIDVEAARQRNITILTAPEGNRDAVAEHAVGMLLMLLNHLKQADAQVRQGIWDREGNRGNEIKGKTVGIIGYGNVGREMARRLSGFDCQVLCYDHKPSPYADAYATEATMAEIYEQTDILTLHIPLTSETWQMVDAAFLKRFRKPIYLINTARGEIVVLRDLLTLLQEAKVLGACLDVLQNEKLHKLTADEQAIHQALAALPQVLFSPHVAGWTHESYLRINQVLCQKIQQWLTNQTT